MKDNYSEVKVQSDRKCCLYNEFFRQSKKGEVYEFDSVGFRIWHFVSAQGFHGSVSLPPGENFIFMCFCINKSGELEYGIQQKISFSEGHHNLVFLPNSKSAKFSVAKDERLEVFAIILQAQVFFNYFPVNSNELFIKFKQQVQKKKEIVPLNPINSPTNLAMKGLINAMIGSNRYDECKHIYFKAKIIELLGLQLEQFMSLDNLKTKSTSLKLDELERIHEVKAILERNPEKSYTLLGLAHLIGTNDATLKKHFKMTFGTTVFNYLNRCRMEKAHLILEQKDYKVSHVAQDVGFKYASHFSAAFKKYFGYSPAELKNADKTLTSTIN